MNEIEFKDRSSTLPIKKTLTVESVEMQNDLPFKLTVVEELIDNGTTDQKGTILNAQILNGVVELANTAQTAAENAEEKAEEAQTAADAAQTTANAAQTTANAAQTDAGNALVTANTAQSMANTAQTAAENAEEKAEEAQATANAALAQIAEQGIFVLDTKTLEIGSQIYSFLSQASVWGSQHNSRAEVYFKGEIPSAVSNTCNFMSHINYHGIHQTTSTEVGGFHFENCTNCGFEGGKLQTSRSNGPLYIKNCTDFDFSNMKIIDFWGDMLLEECGDFKFENCLIKGGTLHNHALTIKNTATNSSRFLFENCIFDNTFDVLIDASGVTNSNCTLTFINCVDGEGKSLTVSKIASGAAKIEMVGTQQESGIFTVSALAPIADINAKIEEASAWGTANKVRATMKILGTLGNTDPAGIVFKSNVNYSLKLETYHSGFVFDGISNCGLQDSYIFAVGTNGLKIKNCTDIDILNCTIINEMSDNVVENSSDIYFENCTLKGGTCLNKTVSVVDTETAKNTVTYTNCKFNNAYTTLIDASGVSNSNSVITLMNCVDANLSPIAATQVVKGSGSMRSLSATEL